MSIFDHPADRRGTASEKYNKKLISLFAGNSEAEPFWVADMDFRTPQVIIDALQKELATGVLGYVSNEGIIPSFLSFLERRHSWRPDPSLVVIAPGMLSSIALLLDTYSEKGDSVLLPYPAYKPFVSVLNKLERKIIPIHLAYDQDSQAFSFPMMEYRELMEKKQPKVLLFCSPHNPTGMVFSKETLEQVASIAADTGSFVISDEIHADLVYQGKQHTPFNLVTEGKNLKSATCMAPSKTFNIAGEHFSMVICSDREIKKKLVGKLGSFHVAPDYLAMTAAKAAYNEGYEWLSELIPYLEKNVNMIESLLTEQGSTMRLIKPSASFIALLDCTEILRQLRKTEGSENLPSGEAGYLSNFFGIKAGIALNDGSWFGSGYESFVRFNYATSKEKVRNAVLAMIEAEKQLLG